MLCPLEILTWTSMGKIRKCGISVEQLIVGCGGWQFGSRCSRNYSMTCRGWANLKNGTLNFFSIQHHMGVEILKRYSFHRFHPISAKLYGNFGLNFKLYETYDNQGRMWAFTFLGDQPILTNLWHFKISHTWQCEYCCHHADSQSEWTSCNI